MLLPLHSPITTDSYPAHQVVWQYEATAPSAHLKTKVLCWVWVLFSVVFCPWLLQDRKNNSSSLHPLLTEHNEGDNPPTHAPTHNALPTCYGCSMWLIHPEKRNRYIFLSWLQRQCRFYWLQDEIRGGDHLRMKTASLPSSAAGRFPSNYDPIVVCCVLSAPPCPKLRQLTEIERAVPEV